MSKSQRITPWRNMIAAALLIMASLGVNSGGMTLFYLPVTRDLGFSQAEFAMYFTLTMLTCGVVMLWSGRLLTRYRDKLRSIVLAALTVNGVGIFCYSFCSQLWQFYCLSIVRGAAFAFAGGVSATMVVNDWFQDKRPLATSVVFMGASLGSILFTKLSNAILNHYTWHSAYRVLGCLIVVLAVVVALLLTPAPERMQLQPYRSRKPQKMVRGKKNEGYLRAEVLKMPVFWVFMAGIFLLNIAALCVMQNVNNSLIVDKGYTRTAASNLFSILQICNAGGGLLVGWLLDRISFGKVVTIYLSAQIVAMICMFQAGMLPFAVAFCVLFGASNNVCSSVTAGITGEIFGLRDYGSIYSTLGLPLMLGMAFGPTVAGAVFDAAGSYSGVWALSIALIVVVLPCYLVPYTLHRRGKLKPPADQTALPDEL